MIQLTNACVSSVDEAKGNTSNLLFSGQILPERNAGLNGAPSLKLEPGAGCVTAVFDGAGDAANKAAYLAAGAFRAAADSLRGLDDLEALFSRIDAEVRAANAERESPCSVSAAAACVFDGQLALACIGGCRAYLLRDRALYLLSRPDAATPPQSPPPAPDAAPRLGGADSAPKPFTVIGAILPGDQILLCTGWLPAALDAREMLRTLAEAETPSAALQQLSRRAGSGRGDIAAVLLSAEGAADAEPAPEPDVEPAPEPADARAEAPAEDAPAPAEEAPEVPAEDPTDAPEAPADD